MLEKTTAPSKATTYSSAIGPLSNQSASFETMGTSHLSTVLATYAAIEFLAVACSAYIASSAYYFFVLRPRQWQDFPEYILAAIAIATLVLLISLGFQNFVAIRRQDRTSFLWRGVGAVALAFSFFLTILFLTQLANSYSRGTLIVQIVGVSITIVIARAIFYSWLQTAIASNRIEARRVALIGDVSHCAMFSNRLQVSGIQAVGFFRLPKVHNITNSIAPNPEIRNLIAKIRPLQPDDIMILADDQIMHAIFDLASPLAELPAGVHIVPVNAISVLNSAQIGRFGNVQTIQVYRPPLSVFDLFVKRAFDIVAATIGLIVFSPLFLAVSIAIKLDSRGPIFFRQTRHGFNNDDIRVIKFRSLTTMEDGGNFTQVVENDPRVTRFGRILRRTNIDELPQLINVLRGEMSIVGPRPHATAHNALFSNMIAPFSRRHNVRPGITGWAQINGFRGATDTFEKMQRRIEYDLQYVDNWSFLLDMKIIVLTLFSKKSYLNAC